MSQVQSGDETTAGAGDPTAQMEFLDEKLFTEGEIQELLEEARAEALAENAKFIQELSDMICALQEQNRAQGRRINELIQTCLELRRTLRQKTPS